MWKPLWDYVGFASLRSVIGPENSCYSPKNQIQSSLLIFHSLTIFLFFFFFIFYFSFTLFAGIFICFALQDIYKILRMRPKDRCDTTLPAPDGSNVTNKPVGKYIPSVKVWKVLADVSNN